MCVVVDDEVCAKMTRGGASIANTPIRSTGMDNTCHRDCVDSAVEKIFTVRKPWIGIHHRGFSAPAESELSDFG